MVAARGGICATAALAIFALAMVPPIEAKAGDVTVTIVAPLSGAMIGGSSGYETGMRLAVEAINDAGGLLGRQLRMTVVDDACDPDQAEVAAEQALADQPLVIIGHFCSEGAIRAATVYARAGVIAISPTATSPHLTEMGVSTVFRMVGRDDRQGLTAARALAQHWSQRRIAIFDDGAAYSRGLADIVRDQLRKRGIAPVVDGHFTPNALNYDPVIQTLRKQHVEVLYAAGHALDVGLILREIAAAALTVQVLGPDTLNVSDLQDVAGSATEGLLFTYPPDPMRMPSAQPMLSAAKSHGEHLERRTLLTYAALQVWAEAVKRSGSFAAPVVAATLRGAPLDTILGPVSFDAKGDIVGPLSDWIWYRWHQGTTAPGTPR